MRSLIFLFIIISSVMSSCQTEKDKFVGIWEKSSNTDWWIQFNEDGTFDYGWKSVLKFTGKYELDESIINLRTDDKYYGSKKYIYTLENNSLTLIKLNGEIDVIYKRKSN